MSPVFWHLWLYHSRHVRCGLIVCTVGFVTLQRVVASSGEAECGVRQNFIHLIRGTWSQWQRGLDVFGDGEKGRQDGLWSVQRWEATVGRLLIRIVRQICALPIISMHTGSDASVMQSRRTTRVFCASSMCWYVLPASADVQRPRVTNTQVVQNRSNMATLGFQQTCIDRLPHGLDPGTGVLPRRWEFAGPR